MRYAGVNMDRKSIRSTTKEELDLKLGNLYTSQQP
mgnify:FL=1